MSATPAGAGTPAALRGEDGFAYIGGGDGFAYIGGEDGVAYVIDLGIRGEGLRFEAG
jgi:hypothetical protein